MSKMKKHLNVSDGLKLVNDVIEGTIHQQNLISWKLKHNCYYKDESDLGRVGYKFWRNVMLRNGHCLKSKIFTCYLNFRDMYDQIEDVLVDEAKVAFRLPKPVFMNAKDEIVNGESSSVGC